MGKYSVVLDPAGYYYVEEPGAHFAWTGAELASKFKPDPQGTSVHEHRFYVPPGSRYLMCRPRQANPEWYADARLNLHVQREAAWVWAEGVKRREFEGFTRKPDGTSYPKNQWINAVVPASFTSLSAAHDYAALGSAVGITFPAGFGTIALCEQVPVGDRRMFAGYTPYLQWTSFPSPDDLLVFGWSDVACVLHRDTLHLARTPLGSLGAWELMGKWGVGELKRNLHNAGANMFQAMDVRAQVRSLMALWVKESLFLVLSEGATFSRPLYNDPVDNQPQPGPWWIGARPGQKLQCQVQVVGYEDAATDVMNLTNVNTFFFDLGTGYKPTLAPGLGVQWVLHTTEGETGTGEITETVTADGTEQLSDDTGEQVTYQLRGRESGGNCLYQSWLSDGTAYRGTVHLELFPNNPGGVNAGYFSPHIAGVDLRFLVKLTARTGVPTTLGPTSFKGFRAETSLYEPAGKRVLVDIWASGVDDLDNAGFFSRENYPLHILEDTDNDGTAETLRIAAWVETPDLQELTESTAYTDPIRYYRLEARGMLSRGQQRWLYLPQLVDDAGAGTIEQAFAVKEAIRSFGVDTDDTAKYLPATDVWAGTERGRLPGTWQSADGQAPDIQSDCPWGPDWDEQKLEYAARIAREWAGWVLYEELGGRVRYHPDLMLELIMGYPYWRSGTLYATKSAAQGAGLPGQYYLADHRRHIVPIEANVVRVSGRATDGAPLTHVIDRDQASITTLAAENYLGEPRVVSRVAKLAVTRPAARGVARVLRLRASRKRIVWPREVMLAPWRFSTALEVGQVWAYASGGDWLVTHLETELLRNTADSVVRTRVGGEKLPGSAVLGSGSGAYPGRGTA